MCVFSLSDIVLSGIVPTALFIHASPPPFAAHFAEVEIDTETGDIDLLQYVAGCDCGTPINPQLALGQVQGGAMNAISFALTEEYIFNEKGS